MPVPLGKTLVVTALTSDRGADRSAAGVAARRSAQRRRNPDEQISWDQPHEGNLFEHLYARRSFQASEPPRRLPAQTVRILSFTGGAGAMYCGSCLRDNALAAGAARRGHDVMLTPVYTPTRTDERNVSAAPRVLRRHQRLPRAALVALPPHAAISRSPVGRRMGDRLASKRQIKVDPKSLGELTVSMLRGEHGFQRKEIAKLLDWLTTEPRFDVINLPYTLLIGLAEPLKRTLRAPVCCTLQGEDLFLDGLGEPYRQQSLDLIRAASVARGRVPPGQPVLLRLHARLPRRPAREDAPGAARASTWRATRRGRTDARDAFTIGYLARIAPEKGLHVLADAYRKLRQRPGIGRIAAAWRPAIWRRNTRVPRRHPARPAARRPRKEFEYRGEVDRAQKIEFLQSWTCSRCRPLTRSRRGMFLFEAMASGVPVVQPRQRRVSRDASSARAAGCSSSPTTRRRWPTASRSGATRVARRARWAPPGRPACGSTTSNTMEPSRRT